MAREISDDYRCVDIKLERASANITDLSGEGSHLTLRDREAELRATIFLWGRQRSDACCVM